MRARSVMAAVTLAVAMVMVIAMVPPVHSFDCSAVADLSLFKLCMPAMVGTAPAFPSTECCDAIKKADLTCLCTDVPTPTIPDLNREAAVMLPKKCGVVPPGLSTCDKHGNPFTRKPTNLH